jgi:hypothetical protein
MYKDYIVTNGSRNRRKAFMLFEKGGLHHTINSSSSKQPYHKEMIQSKSLNLHSFFKHYNPLDAHDQLILNAICSKQFLFQIVYSIYCMQQCGLMHDDLHDGNILFDFFETPIPFMTYRIDELDLVFQFQNVYLIPKIIDFDHGILLDHTIENVKGVSRSNLLISSPFNQFQHKFNADGTKDFIRILTYMYWGLTSVNSAYAESIFKILGTFYNYRPLKTMTKQAKVHYDCAETKEVYGRVLETSWYGEAYFKTKHEHYYFLNDLPMIERDGKTFRIRLIQYQNMEHLLNLFHYSEKKSFQIIWNGMQLGKDFIILNMDSNSDSKSDFDSESKVLYSTKSIPLVQKAIVDHFETQII